MRGKTTTIRVVPRGEYMLTLKARGELVGGSLEELREELYLTRRAIQYVIDALWELDKLPTINQAHQIFTRYLGYRVLEHIKQSRYTSTHYQYSSQLREIKEENQYLRNYQLD